MVRRNKTPKPQAGLDAQKAALKATKMAATNGNGANGNHSRNSSDGSDAKKAADDTTGPIFFWRETHPEYGFLSHWYTGVPFHDPESTVAEWATVEHYVMCQKATMMMHGNGSQGSTNGSRRSSGGASNASTNNNNNPAALMTDRILQAAHPRKAHSLGREVTPFNSAVWAREREDVVKRANYAKFSTPVVDESETSANSSNNDDENNDKKQPPDTKLWKLGCGPNAKTLRARSFRAALLRTGDRELVLANPHDRLWGIGFSAEQVRAARERGAAGEVGEDETNDAADREAWGLNLGGKCLMEVRDEFRDEEGALLEAAMGGLGLEMGTIVPKEGEEGDDAAVSPTSTTGEGDTEEQQSSSKHPRRCRGASSSSSAAARDARRRGGQVDKVDKE